MVLVWGPLFEKSAPLRPISPLRSERRDCNMKEQRSSHHRHIAQKRHKTKMCKVRNAASLEEGVQRRFCVGPPRGVLVEIVEKS